MPAFVDANILVYAEDRDSGSKHGIARDLIADLWRSGEGVLSVQVLQEFFVVVTRKMPRPLSPAKPSPSSNSTSLGEWWRTPVISSSRVSVWHRLSKSRFGMRWSWKQPVSSAAIGFGPKT